jgi:hypothetical protein
MGTGEAAHGADGLAPGKTALYWPQDITFGPDGRAFVADWNTHRIRMVENGVVRTIIGTGALLHTHRNPINRSRCECEGFQSEAARSPGAGILLCATPSPFGAR